MKKFLLSFFAVMLAVFSVQAEEKSGTIIFKTSNSDSSAAATNANFVSGQVAANGGFTLTCTETNNCYTGQNGLKMSSKSANGSFTLGLGDTYNVKKVIVNAVKYSSDAAKLSVNGTAVQTLSTSSTDYTFNINADVSQIKVDMTKRGYIASITIVYEVAGENEATAPVTPSLADDADFVGSMKVAISCETEGAEIHYTTDGTEPTEDSDVYSEPFEITETTTVKAIAFNEVGPSYIATATYTRVAATPVISFVGDASAVEGEVVVSIETENDAVAYYTLNGVTPNASSTVYEKPITIKANATLKVFAIEAGKYKSGVKTQEFVMAVAGGDNIEGESYTLSFANKNQRTEFSTSKQVWKQNGITFTNDKASSTSNVADYANPARFYKNSEIIVEFTSPIAKIEFACNNTEYANDLKSAISGATVDGKNVTVLLDGTSTSFAVKLTQAKVFMDALTVTPVAEVSAYELNVTEAGWATLYLGYDAIIPEGVTCYVISEVGAESVQLEEVTGVVPANTAVIVEAAEGEYTFDVVEDNTEEIESVMLGTTMNKYITEEAYVLGVVDGVVGLYKAEMAGGVWLNNANKAYLPASEVPTSAQGAASFSFRFGEGTTAIENVEVENEVKTIYDLTGRRVEAITAPGIYIVGGKKVLVK